jgi:2',3'-cyclic-nucleotide 2'-phosphodiesterase (5'-nucleotidase family)
MRSLKRLLLLLVADAEPVLHEDDAAADEHLLERRAGTEELVDVVFGAEAHDALDAGPVVPGAVEDHPLAGAGRWGT